MKAINRSFPVIRAVSNLRYVQADASSANTTVDSSEVEQFKKMGSRWWDKGGIMTILMNMNHLRVPFIRDGLINMGAVDEKNAYTDKPLKGLKIIDIGCGGGFLAEPLARLGANVTGLDATYELIHIAKNHKELDRSFTDDNLNYVHSSIENYAPDFKNEFDAVVSSEVVEHVESKQEFLKHCIMCLKPGGSVFITTMSKTLLCKIGIFMSEYVMMKVEKGTHQYDKMISPHELQRLLEACGCTTKRIHGMMINPINDRWRWTKNTDVNYALHAVKNVEQRSS